jgi:ABC-type transporter Mla maintaining outer membrane lipid asymmetry permease subunit MlaE
MKDPDPVPETLPKTNGSHRYTNSVRFIIKAVYKFISMLGGIYLLLGEAASIAVKGLFIPEQQIGRSSLFAQMVRVGVKAIPIVFLVQMSIGMIVPLQIFPKLDEFGQGEQIATINAISGFREF